MMRIFTVICLLFSFLTTKSVAQSSNTPLQINGGKNCAEAQLVCNLNILGTTMDNDQAHQGVEFCSYFFRLPEWYRFVAGDTAGTIVLIKEVCWNDDNSNALEMAIYDASDCYAWPLACQSATTSDTIQLQLSNLVLGHEYNILINTNPIAFCDYRLYGIGSVAVPPQVAGFNAPLEGVSEICETYTTPICKPASPPNASYVEWQYSGIPSFVLSSSDTCIDVYCPNDGFVTIKARPGNACVFGPWSTKTIEVHRNTYGYNMVDQFIPFEDTPLALPWANDTVPAQEGSHSYYGIAQSIHGCDSAVCINYKVSPPIDEARCIVYADLTNFGSFNYGDAIYNNGVILSSSSGQFASTGSDGFGLLQNIQAGDTIFIASPPTGYVQWPNHYIFYPKIEPWSMHAIGMKPVGTGPDLELFHSSAVFRPGFNTTSRFKIKNRHHQSGSTVLTVIKPSWLLVDNAIPFPSSISGDTLRWNITLSPWSEPLFSVVFRTPSGIPLGTPLFLSARLEPLSAETNTSNNNLDLSFVVVSSFDPNDKTVQPAYLLPGDFETPPFLTYTIRFQNTGSYQADFVRLIDTLQEGLDPATFEFIDASHPCTWRMYGEGIVDFFFEDIFLPDSLSDPEGSNGYAVFRIRSKGSLEFGDIMENFADIYFDYNPPIRTNTAETQAVYFIPGEGISAPGMRVRPNPAAFFLRCSWTAPISQDGTLRLISMDGIPRLTETVPAGENTWLLDVQQLDPGMYVAVLEAGSVVYVKQVVVIRAAEVRGWR